MPEPEVTRDAIPIIVSPDPAVEDDAKGLFRRGSEPPIVKEIPIEQLQGQLHSLTADIQRLMDGAEMEKSEGLRLTELSVQVEITASGGINLIGTASVGAAASMTLTFSR